MGVEVGQLPSSVTEERHGREAWGQRGLVRPPGAACWALPTTSLTCVTPTLGEKSGGWRSPAHRGVTTRRGHPGVGSLPTGQHGLLRQVPPGGVPADSGLIRSHTLPNQSSNPGHPGYGQHRRRPVHPKEPVTWQGCASASEGPTEEHASTPACSPAPHVL